MKAKVLCLEAKASVQFSKGSYGGPSRGAVSYERGHHVQGPILSALGWCEGGRCFYERGNPVLGLCVGP